MRLFLSIAFIGRVIHETLLLVSLTKTNSFKMIWLHDRFLGRDFLVLICATVTAQQSYCHDMGVRHPSGRRYVRPSTSFSRKPSSGLTPNFSDRYLSTISPDHFLFCFVFVFQNFKFSIFYNFFFRSFVFVNIGPYGTKKFQTTSSLKVRTRFISKNCILLGKISTKVVERIVEFEIPQFHFAFLPNIFRFR